MKPRGKVAISLGPVTGEAAPSETEKRAKIVCLGQQLPVTVGELDCATVVIEVILSKSLLEDCGWENSSKRTQTFVRAVAEEFVTVGLVCLPGMYPSGERNREHSSNYPQIALDAIYDEREAVVLARCVAVRMVKRRAVRLARY